VFIMITWGLIVFMTDKAWFHVSGHMNSQNGFHRLQKTISHQETLHGHKVNTGRVSCPPDDNEHLDCFFQKECYIQHILKGSGLLAHIFW